MINHEPGNEDLDSYSLHLGSAFIPGYFAQRAVIESPLGEEPHRAAVLPLLSLGTPCCWGAWIRIEWSSRHVRCPTGLPWRDLPVRQCNCTCCDDE
jgi:hypothetical protein